MKIEPTSKQTDPWPMVPLGEVAVFKSGYRNSNTATPHGEYPFFVCAHDVLRCDEFDFDQEAIIMAGNNADGVFHLHHYSGKFAARQRTYVISPRTNRLEFRWLFLQLSLLQRDFKANAIGTTTQYVTIGMLLNATIPLPDVETQKTIAAALSDVDALLEGLDRLIVKKRDLKQAAMQQLLTGQTRLPGFEKEWEVRRLGDHVTFLRNGANSRAELTIDDPVKYLHYGDIHTQSGPSMTPFGLPSLSQEKANTLGRLNDGDLIFVDASEDLEGVGKSVEVRKVGGVDLVAGLHTIAARFDKNILADGFKAYLQFCPRFIHHLRRLAAGTKVYATNRAHIASVEMPLPSIEEQIAIASVFSDMDSEISALDQRRAKTAALKQAMMHELLISHTRLVEPEQREAAVC